MFSQTFLLLIIFGQKLLSNCEPILVQLSDKSVVSGQTIDFLGTHLHVFLGIPFAKPPTGDLRFKKPVPIGKLSDGVYEATELPPPCVNYKNGQPFEMPWTSERANFEDCLYLNVWSPNTSGDSKDNRLFPVMVWIYGGAFQTGSIDLDLYNGEALSALGNVVVVTFNYRTGLLGLFYSGTEEAPGNVAIHDQRLALQWVHNNIDRFGGDPNAVTIFGESAGSISVGVHILSSLSGSLFSRAILQSGSPYHNIGGVPSDLALKQSKMIAKDAKCLTHENVIDMSCMRNLSTKDIENIYQDIYSKGIALQLIYGDEISPKHPIDVIDNKQFKPIEAIVGSNRDEGSSVLFMALPEIFSRSHPMNMTKSYATQFIKAISYNWWLGELSEDQIRSIVEFYMCDVPEHDFQAVRQSLVDLIGDSLFICPSVYLADALSEVNGSKVFYYQFTHIKHFDNHWGEWMGSPHFDDVQYVFGHPLRYPDKYSEPELQLSLNIIKSWTSFAWKGEPLNTFGDNVWPPYEPTHRHLIEVNGDKRNSYLKSGPRLNECQFWKPFFTSDRIVKHEEL